MPMYQPTRRAVLGAALAVAGTGALAACSDGGGHGGAHAPGGAQDSGTYVSPGGREVAAAEKVRGSGPVREVSLTATRTRLDLGGGTTVASWAYGDRLPGRAVRVTAGETLDLTLANHLPQPTSMHWHGLALRNDMDGVPGLTQRAIAPGATSGTGSRCRTRGRTGSTRTPASSRTGGCTRRSSWRTRRSRWRTTRSGSSSSTTGWTGWRGPLRMPSSRSCPGG